MRVAIAGMSAGVALLRCMDSISLNNKVLDSKTIDDWEGKKQRAANEEEQRRLNIKGARRMKGEVSFLLYVALSLATCSLLVEVTMPVYGSSFTPL